MTEQINDPAANLEQAARILGVPLNSKRLLEVIANPELFHALFQGKDASGKIKKPNPLDVFRP